MKMNDKYQLGVEKFGKRGRVKQFMGKFVDLFLLTLPHTITHRHKYTISWRNGLDSEPKDVCLLHVNKLSDKITPFEALLLNFCHTIEDIKQLQKQPEKLDFLQLKPKEVESMLMEIMFVFEKRRCIELAAEQLNKNKRKADCCQRF